MWEYKILLLGDLDEKQIDKELDKLGNNRWELIVVDNRSIAYLKRAKV